MGLRDAVERGLSAGPLGRVLRAAKLPEAAYRRFFQSPRGGENFQYGRYATYAQAAQAIPPAARSGWDNPGSAQHYIDSTTQPSSYAVLFWLVQTLRDGMRVIDLGGGTGQMYHTFVARRPLPPGVEWHVVDVAAAAELGRARAAERGSTDLAFHTDMSTIAAPDVLHASGAIQFMGDPLPGLLDRLQALPHTIIINKIVLTDRPTFWTLHNIGTGICTYAIFNERDFLAYFQARGYVVKDRWRVAEMGMLIPFHPEGYVPFATGFCFERTA